MKIKRHPEKTIKRVQYFRKRLKQNLSLKALGLAGFLIFQSFAPGCLPKRATLSKPGKYNSVKTVNIEGKEDLNYKNIKHSVFINSIKEKYKENYRDPQRALYLTALKLIREDIEYYPVNENKFAIIEEILNSSVITDSLEIRKNFNKYSVIWETGIVPGTFMDSLETRIKRGIEITCDYHEIRQNPFLGIGEFADIFARYPDVTVTKPPEHRAIFKLSQIDRESKKGGKGDGKKIEEITIMELKYGGKIINLIQDPYTFSWKVTGKESNDPEKVREESAEGICSFFEDILPPPTPQERFALTDVMRQKLETLADGMIYVENRNRLLDDVGIQQVIYPCPCDMPGNSQDYNRVDWNCLANINDIFGKYSKIVYNDSINCRVELKICDYYGNEILNSCNDIRGSLTKPMDLNGEFWWRTISKIFANLDSTDLKEVSVGVRLTNNYTNEVARRIINYNFPEPNKVPNYRGQIAAGPPNEAYLPPFVVDGFKIKKDSSINIWFPVTGLFPDQSDSSLFKGNVRISLYNIETHDRIPHARIVTETLKFGKIGDTLGTIDFSFYPLEDSLKIERDGEITEYSAKYNITSDGRNGYFIINIPTNVKKGLYNILIDVMSPDSTDLEKTVTTADIPYVNIE